MKYFNGKIGNYTIYNRVLTSKEISKIIDGAEQKTNHKSMNKGIKINRASVKRWWFAYIPISKCIKIQPYYFIITISWK